MSKWVIEFAIDKPNAEFSAFEFEVKESQNGTKLFVLRNNNYGPNDIHRTYNREHVLAWYKEER